MPPQWSAPKAKVQLRLAVQRLRTLQQKKEAQAKASRRDIATLLEKGKVETARIKVESLINEDIHVELLELLELYSELLLARFGLLDQNTREPDPGVSEGVCNIIHAAPRTELKELHVLREILMHKYGREFSIAVMENRDGRVSDRVINKLTVAPPSLELVDAYMTEIAKAYSVDWAPPSSSKQNPEGGDKETSSADQPSAVIAVPDLSNDVKPAPNPPDLPPIEGTNEKNTPTNAKSVSDKSKSPSTSPPKKDEEEDDFDALAKRFAALKKR
ncbi:Vacuolar protein sorting-associated protein ist1 [Pleurotus ostreatus]|nr:Vacuolar protein sorting-associated protein ist1 [Pleurotus ostreatus]